MSEIYEVNPNKSYEAGWETLDDDSQEFEETVNVQLHSHQHAACSQLDKKVHIDEEYQSYDIVIESPGVKAENQKVDAFEVNDIEVSVKKMELLPEKNGTATSSDD